MGDLKPAHPLLIVGLGNPGPGYAPTRHNAGAQAVERLARRLGRPLRHDHVRGAWLAREAGLILARPDAFMNESGPSVRRLAEAFDVPDPLLVSDDLDLPLGTIRFRTKGSSGGHNGVASVIAALGTEEFPRLKIGIGRPAGQEDVVDWVLTPFGDDELEAAHAALERAADALALAAREGLPAAMDRYSE